MRHIFIGDIHGCLDEFKELIEKVNLRPEDKVVCIGDFMDRGPDPVGCVRFARERGFQSVLGNHESKHIKWRENEAKADPTYVNKMTTMTPERVLQNEALSDEDFQWLVSLPVVMIFKSLRGPGYIAVHGGLLPNVAIEDQPLDKMLVARWVNADGKPIPSDLSRKDRIPLGGFHWTEFYQGSSHVVYGHEPHSRSQVFQRTNAQGGTCYGIDTACVFGGRLTALVTGDAGTSIVQVQAKRAYLNPPFELPE